MDIIDKVKNILETKSGLIAPIFDIHYDSQNNVTGHITDKVFETLDHKKSQKLIWNSLGNYLDQSELMKILSIFHETPRERLERLIGTNFQNNTQSPFWKHSSPDLTTYWLFVDVLKIIDDYKTFFLIINQREGFKQGLTFEYTKDVLAFMELEDDSEITHELYSNTFNTAEAEIKLNLIAKYDNLTKKGLWGSENIFSYVYDKFELKPVSKSQLIFSPEEISILKPILETITDFKILNDLNKAIQKSEAINHSKSQLSGWSI